jgi:hypothetical protein
VSTIGIQHLTIMKNQQASRLRPIPSELEGYIRLANVLPAPEKLPGAEPNGKLPVREHWDATDKDLENLQGRYARFRAIFKGANLREKYPVEVIQRCRSLKIVRSVLYTIARSQGSNHVAGVPVGAHLENLVSVRPDAGGNLRILHDPLLQALQGVEASRIRECPICGRIFWAGRVDRPCCGKRCAGVRRTRRWRDRYPEKYKPQRIKKAEAADALGDKAAQFECERKKLESLPEYNSARRSPRLPNPHK